MELHNESNLEFLCSPTGQALLNSLMVGSSFSTTSQTSQVGNLFSAGSGSGAIESLISGVLFRQQQQAVNAHDSSQSLLHFLQQKSAHISAASFGSTIPTLPQSPIDRRDVSLSNFNSCGLAAMGPSVLPHSMQRPVRKKKNLRQEFFILVKHLLNVLKEYQDMDRLFRAKSIIVECTQRNRSGEAGFSDLQRSIESRLRRTIGEVY